MATIRCLTSLRAALAAPAANAFAPSLRRAAYSKASMIGSKRLLQTHTHPVSSLHTNPPFPVSEVSLATPTSAGMHAGAPPPPPVAAAPPAPRKFRARKAAMALTAPAVQQLKELMDLPEPKLIRVGVKNRGCSGLAYDLQYVDTPGKFDEEVIQDGVRVLIDSKALFSIIGSEMDWVEDKLSARFVFTNPNISMLLRSPG